MKTRMQYATALAFMAGTLATNGFAQSIPLTDRPHYPLGGSTVTLSPSGLEVANLGSSGNDGVVLLPHPDTREMHVSIEEPGGGGGGAGGTLKVKASWNLKENTKRTAETMTANYLPGGLVEVSFDFHECNPSSLTAEYYNNGVLVLTEDGIDPNPSGGDPTLRVFPGAVMGVALDLSWRYYPGPPPRHGYNIGGPGWETGMTIGGTILNFDHVVVTAVTPTPMVESLSSYEITTNAMSSFTITGETMTLGLACDGDITFDGYVDDADFVEFATAYDQLLCP